VDRDFRELSYRYQPKHAPDGQPIKLGAVIHNPKRSAAARPAPRDLSARAVRLYHQVSSAPDRDCSIEMRPPRI
jgi:hypothetical protein